MLLQYKFLWDCWCSFYMRRIICIIKSGAWGLANWEQDDMKWIRLYYAVLIYTDITRRDFVSVCRASGERNWITSYLSKKNSFDAPQFVLAFLIWSGSFKDQTHASFLQCIKSESNSFFRQPDRSPCHWLTDWLNHSHKTMWNYIRQFMTFFCSYKCHIMFEFYIYPNLL